MNVTIAAVFCRAHTYDYAGPGGVQVVASFQDLYDTDSYLQLNQLFMPTSNILVYCTLPSSWTGDFISKSLITT